MKKAIHIAISLDKQIDKQKFVAAISEILKINDVNIYFFYSQDNQLKINNTKVFIDYIPLTNSVLTTNINISIAEPPNYPSKFCDIDFAISLAKILAANVYIPAPLSYKYSIIRIEPTGKLYGANEYETDEEFEYLDDITLLNKKAIENLKKAIEEDAMEEEFITEQTQLGNY